jgi:DNA helicase-2/ATP-dependent DNA helicase PcrA
VAQQILEDREAGVPLNSQAVLFRTSHHSAQLEIELARRNIPFVKYGGTKFLESAHVKDVLGIFRWCTNPLDRVSGFRVLQLLPGIGPTTTAKILDQVEKHKGALRVLPKIKVPRTAQQDWPGFVKLIKEMRAANASWPSGFRLVREWYEPHLQQLHDESESRVADLAQLEQIAPHFSSRDEFLTDLALDPPESTRVGGTISEADAEYTVLSTIHSAKGREWRAVRILNVVDGCIPSNKATRAAEIEEERRLLYVAMTRAMDELDLIVPDRLYMPQQPGRGARHASAASRFIPPSANHLFERCHRNGQSRQAGKARQNPNPKTDIPKTLVKRWSRKR